MAVTDPVPSPRSAMALASFATSLVVLVAFAFYTQGRVADVADALVPSKLTLNEHLRTAYAIMVWAFYVMGIVTAAVILLGHLGIVATRREKKRGRSLAVAGLAIGYTTLAIYLGHHFVPVALAGFTLPFPAF